jgi:hypothetical protein
MCTNHVFRLRLEGLATPFGAVGRKTDCHIWRRAIFALEQRVAAEISSDLGLQQATARRRGRQQQWQYWQLFAGVVDIVDQEDAIG